MDDTAQTARDASRPHPLRYGQAAATAVPELRLPGARELDAEIHAMRPRRRRLPAHGVRS